MISIFFRLLLLFVLPYGLFLASIQWGGTMIQQTIDQQNDKPFQSSSSMALVVDSLSFDSFDSLLLTTFSMQRYIHSESISSDSFSLVLQKNSSQNYTLTYNSASAPNELYQIRWLLSEHSLNYYLADTLNKPMVTTQSSFNMLKTMGQWVEQYTQIINSIFNLLFLILVFWPIQKLSLRRALAFRSFLWKSIVLFSLGLFISYLGYYAAINTEQKGLINSLLFTLKNNFSWYWPVYHLMIYIPFVILYVAVIWPYSLDRKDRYLIHAKQFWSTISFIVILSLLSTINSSITAWFSPFIYVLACTDMIFSDQLFWIDAIKSSSMNVLLSLGMVFLILRLKRSLR